ncbi:serine--tRNA ligase [Candidatus Shapirobacteria bacterium]|nr:serine--tRNA ligase [Candidatus Shapirobacteria bacterium]
MLSIDFVRQNKELVKKAASEKQLDPKVVDQLLDADAKRRELIQKIEALRQQRKIASQEREIEEGKKIKEELGKLEPELKKIEKEYRKLMFLVPNIPSPDTPEDDQEIYRWGDKPKFNFAPLSHLELGEKLDLIDLKKGAKTAGFRGYYLKNEAAQLHFALLFYSWQKIISKGFTPFLPPTILREFTLLGSGHFPFGREDIYQIANPGKLESGEKISEPLFLAGTAEPSLLAYFANETLREEDLPVKVCGWTQCYRSEVGSYGRDTQGIYRIHEFMKVEQVVLCQGDEKVSDEWLEKMRIYSEEILRDLKLPYRVIQVGKKEMGAGKRKMYDLETWMPSRHAYGETHSDSNLTDWQARRLNIKYRSKKGEIKFVHCLNNTVLASPRILIAILENYQQKDGSILVPEVLQGLVGKERITR